VLCFLSTNAQFSKVKIDSSAALQKRIDLNPQNSDLLFQQLSKNVQHNSATTKWNRKLINFVKQHKLTPEESDFVLKQTKRKIQNQSNLNPSNEENNTSTDRPIIGASFEGNWFDGYIPPDNSIAISNAGYIVSVVNSNLEYYNTSGNLLFTSSFDDFFNDPDLNSNIYDPVVLYDSGADRFFMVVLHGTSSSTSKVLTCFSQTNNPLDGWWVYKLTGNPLNSGLWFDYPKIGVSNNEAFITGNLFSNDFVFEESVIYQLNKQNGYDGENLNWAYWYNITEEPFTLVPASYGQLGNYGPGMFFISTDNNFISDDEIILYDITDDLSGDPQLEAYSIEADFSLAGNALQYGTDVFLSNGDTRGLQAFYLNGMIHFIFHSEYSNAYNGLNYNRLTVSNLTNSSSIFGLEGYDYSYPSIASFGVNQYDRSVMIGFLRSGASIYPEMRVVSCDHYGNWSASSLVKQGEIYVDYLPTNGVSRWGDYSGISRKQNASSPEIWLSGCFGKYRLGEKAFDTWIAQVTGVTVGTNENPDKTQNKFSIFPQPVNNDFSVRFSLESNTKIKINLIDINGKLVKLLYSDIAKSGINQFSFNRDALSSGVYFLQIKSDSKVLKNEKIIIK
jgi:hypothetical protein